MKARSTGRKWLKMLTRIVVVVCLVLAALFISLQTQPGRRSLSAALSRLLSSGTIAVRIEDIHISSPSRVTAASIRVGDAGGECIRVEGLEIRWAPLALLRGRIEVRSLAAASASFTRVPGNGDSQKKGDARSEGAGTLSLKLDQLRIGDLMIGTGRLGRVEGRAEIAGSSAGWKIKPLKLSADGLAAEADLEWAREAGLSGELRARVLGSTGIPALLQPDLSISEFTLEASASGFVLQARAAVRDLTFGSLVLTTAQFTVEGPASNAALRLEAVGAVAEPISVLAGGRLEWTPSRVGLFVNAVNLDWAATRLQFAEPLALVREQGETDMRLRIDLEDEDLSKLNHLRTFANSRVGGRIDLHIGYEKKSGDGQLSGECVIRDGSVENYILGNIIRDANIRLVSDGRDLVVETAMATDGGAGKITLGGGIRFEPGSGMPYSFDLRCDKARILGRPDVEAVVSGRLGVTGALGSLHAEGKVTIDSSLVQLQNVRSDPPEALDTADAKKEDVASPTREAASVSLRMDVDMPESLYVRSKTVDSVWGGQIQVVLTNGAWGIAGYIEPRRGTVLLLKRQFKITQGRVEFDGSWPPVPSLRIEADFSSRDLLAHLLVVGSIRNPSITLTSEPPLPEDEILSRVLFGKDTSRITPLQALDLASEAAKLRNTGAGTGFLDELQGAVGIDRVEVRNADSGSGGSEIAAGKYLGDRTYVEMRHTSTPESAGMGFYLERDIGPNLILEAETDNSIEMRSGIGVSWKMDY